MRGRPGGSAAWPRQRARPSLRRLGLPLAEIGDALDDPASNLCGALQRQLDASTRGSPGSRRPVHQPYGYREWSARDPEGVLWSFLHPL